MTRIYLVLTLLSFVINANTQTKLDSLQNLANQLMMTDRANYYRVSDEIVDLLKKENKDSLLIENYMSRAMVHFLSRQYVDAINYYDSIQKIAPVASREYLEAQIGAADIYSKLNYPDSLINKKHLSIIEVILPTNDSSLIASEYSNYGNYLVDKAKYIQGIQYLIKSIEFTPQQNSFSRVMNLVKLSKLFLYIHNIEKAEFYSERARELAEGNNYKINGKLLALLRGRIALENGNYSKADSLLKIALTNFKKSREKSDVFSAYVYLANLELWQNNFESCQTYLDSAFEYKNYAKINYTKGQYYLISGRNHLLHNRFTLAQKTLDSLKELSDETQNIFLQASYLLSESELYQATQNYEQSLVYFKRYHQLQDSLLEFKTTGKIYDLESKFQHEEKQKEIELLTAKNQLISVKLEHEKWQKNGILLVAIISFLFLFFLGITYFKVKAKNRTIRKTAIQKDLLLKEIHHRVKNNLQLISSLLNLQERYIKDEKAKQVSMEGKTRVRAMSLIHQFLYQKDDLINLSLDEYFQKLVKELFDIYHISDKDIKMEFNIDQIDLDVDRVIPLGLIFNELMTNIFKYAFPENKTGKVTVNLRKSDANLILEVNDNGVGLSEQNISANNDSFGYTLIKALLSKWKGTFNVTSSNGTQVSIVIPDID